MHYTSVSGHGVLMQGKEPSIADLEVFGVLQAIRGMDTFVELRAQHSELAAWYDRMDALVKSSRLPTDGVEYVDPRAAST